MDVSLTEFLSNDILVRETKEALMNDKISFVIYSHRGQDVRISYNGSSFIAEGKNLSEEEILSIAETLNNED